MISWMWPFTYFQHSPPPPPSSSPSPPPEYDEPWRIVNWREPKENLLRTVKDFQSQNPEVDTLRILLHGPEGAGKSSFINSVDSCFQGRITTRALADSAQGTSFTLECETYKLKKDTPDSYYPFTFIDIMGIHGTQGIQTDDIIKILQGHVRDDYTFNPVRAITDEDPKYNRNPSLKDKIHCLLCVLPANAIQLINADYIKQMREVRMKARDLGIPQAIIMTKIDETCTLVKGNLEKVYTSRKIKERVEECHMKLGVTKSCIYPLKNYHEEDVTNSKIDILLLKALINIVNFANDYVEDHVSRE